MKAINAKILGLSLAALIGGTTLAAAQVYDNPPGWAFQRRGILESQGYDANRYYHDGYRDYAYAPRYRAQRNWHGRSGRYWRDDPPGARFQNRGIDNMNGRDPLKHGH